MHRRLSLSMLPFSVFLCACGFPAEGSPSVGRDARSKPAAPPAAPAPEPPATPQSVQLPDRPPPVPSVPRVPTPLPVPGFHPASHVGPSHLNKWGNPMVVVLHGNYDRPEWQCDMWKDVADFHGWILCPRGIPTPWADPREDRWMYRGSRSVVREIEAAVSSLKARYPGTVSDTGDRVLVGFSLGASLAPNIVEESAGRYRILFIIEGGGSKLTGPRLNALRRAGILGIGFAASTGGNRRAMETAKGQLKRKRIPFAYVNMAGAGHNYRADFRQTGKQALQTLLEKISDSGSE